MDLHRLGDLVADREHRVQRGHRLLEDHGDPVAADRTHRRLVEAEQIAALEAHRAVDDAADLGRQQPQDRQRGDALAAAGFADDAERLAGIDREADAVDGARDAVLGEEMRLEPVDGEDRLHRYIRRASRGSSRSRSPSPTRLTASTTIARQMPGKKIVHGARARIEARRGDHVAPGRNLRRGRRRRGSSAPTSIRIGRGADIGRLDDQRRHRARQDVAQQDLDAPAAARRSPPRR